MLASGIRELAASRNSTLIAAALFEKAVQVWDVKSQKEICEIPAPFCAGARNLALAPDGAILVAGISKARGEVAAYEVSSGRRLWERKLNFPSRLQFDATGQSILCTKNRKSVLRLNVSTGATTEITDGIIRHIEGQYGDELRVPVKEGNGPYRLIAGNQSFEIGRLGFALLDATFSPHFVCLTEAAGPVRCVSRDDGRQRWMFDPSKDGHVLLLHYSPSLDAFFGILRSLNTKGLSSLLRFEVASGVVKRFCDLDSWEEVFVDAADQLVTSSGEVRDLTNGGALVGRLEFPLREYPDE